MRAVITLASLGCLTNKYSRLLLFHMMYLLGIAAVMVTWNMEQSELLLELEPGAERWTATSPIRNESYTRSPEDAGQPNGLSSGRNSGH